MPRFHISKAGDPEPCTATVRACPLGGEHFASPHEAAQHAMALAMAPTHWVKFDPMDAVEASVPTMKAVEWNARSWSERKKEIEKFAQEELRKQGLYGIPVKWSRAAGSWGYARTRTFQNGWGDRREDRDLFMNEQCQDLDEQSVKGVVLHEVAHFKAGHHAGHGHEWKSACHVIDGGRGIVHDTHSYEMNDCERERAVERMKRERAERSSESKWLGVCPQGHEFPSKGKPRSTYLCANSACRPLSRDERVITYGRRGA
jgi:hypothetical protein